MQYVGRITPSRKNYGRDEYGRQRLPDSSRAADADGMAAAGWKTLQHSTSVIVTHARQVAPSGASYGDTMRRLNKMFNTMTAVAPADVPASRGGREGVDIRTTDDYKALAGMPVVGHDSEAEKKHGWSAVDAGSVDKAKKLQARVNIMAKAGAGTFRTKLPAGSTVLYVKRISETYSQQRGGE